MKCKPDDEQDKDLSIDQVKAKRQSEDDEDSSVAMWEEMLRSEYKEDYPVEGIAEPHEHDVLCGRGGEYSV
jgi:hypothetical protein